MTREKRRGGGKERGEEGRWGRGGGGRGGGEGGGGEKGEGKSGGWGGELDKTTQTVISQSHARAKEFD